MKQLILKRRYLETHTEGILSLPDGRAISTLEKPWRDNLPNVSCIPEDTYIVRRDRTGKHQWWSVQDVTNRTFIEIHPATHESQLAGCIAPCMRIINGTGYESRRACNELMKWFGEDSFLLFIQELGEKE